MDRNLFLGDRLAEAYEGMQRTIPMSSKLAEGVNLDPKVVAAMVEQLNGRKHMPYKTFIFGEMPPCEPLKEGELSQAVHMDTNGVVVFPGGWMHPFSFRDIAGEVAYQELLKRPRVQSEYTEEELSDVQEG